APAGPCTVIVSLDVPLRWQANAFQPDVGAGRSASRCNDQLIDGNRLATERHINFATVYVTDAGDADVRTLNPLHSHAEVDLDTTLLERLLDQLVGKRFAPCKQRRHGLDDRERLDAKSVQPDGGLAGDGAATDDGDPARNLVQVRHVPGGPRPGLAHARHRRNRWRSAGSQD